MNTASQPAVGSRASAGARWVQLVLGIVGMVAIANLQYGWTLFVNPIDSKFHWGKAAIQVAFTLFVLAETWLVPFEGYLVDRFGPRWLVAVGGILVGVAWWLNAEARSLVALYAGGLVGGVGAGIVYGTSVGNALKWFPERRGLAAGLTAAAFGAGSALTIVPIANLIDSRGYEAAFIYFGLAQGLVVILCALLLRAPAEDLPFEDNSFDVAVSTLVLCTVDDQPRALRELRRVLKPGGRLLFIEHVRADDQRLARWQDRLNGLQTRLGHGCNCNRPTIETITAAGFEITQLDRDVLRKAPPIVRPLAVGVAQTNGHPA